MKLFYTNILFCIFFVYNTHAYKPANIFLPIRANSIAVEHSLRKFRDIIVSHKSNTVTRKKMCIITSSDEIACDAIFGSRTGVSNTENVKKILDGVFYKDKLDTNKFEKLLLKAQLSVLLSQTVYLVTQIVGLLAVLNVINDLT